MPQFYGAIDLLQNELRNARVQNLGAAPANPVAGQLYYNSTSNILYWWSGTAWVPAMDAGAVGGPPSGPAGGDLAGTYPNPNVRGINGTILANLVTGLLKNTTTTGVPSIAVAADVPTVPPGSLAAGPMSALSRFDQLSNANMATAAINANNQNLINLGNPVNPLDATNKQYVDNLIAGLSWKAPCRAASTANIAALSGAQTIDGVALVAGDRVLVKNQTTASANGIYVVASGAWTRAIDANTAASLLNAAVFVSLGTTQADTAWVQTADNITLGTTAITFVQFGASGGNYAAGNGLTLTGNVFAVGAGTGITVAPGLTSVDTTVIATVAALNAAIAGMTKKFAVALNGTASPEAINHNLNTRDVQVTVLNGASPYTAVEVDWDATTVNQVTIRYNPNLGAGYRAVVVG